MSGKPGHRDPIDGPQQDRRVAGEVKPERVNPADPASDTPDHDGIEIDNAIERPQVGQPGQPGAKLH